MMRKIIIISVWVVLLAGLAILVRFVVKQHQAMVCDKVNITVTYNSDDKFITPVDVNAFLSAKGLKTKGAVLSEIYPEDIEKAISSIPCVEKAEVNTSINADVEIKIVQRKPIVKVFNKYNRSFYIDDKGCLIPSGESHIARLFVANGFIDDMYNPFTKLDVTDPAGKDTVIMKTAIYKIFRMAQFISKDDFWKAMIEEIYINNKGEIELYTKIGELSIIFGGIDNMNEKFRNLLVFFKQGLNKVGWNKYRVINVKYKNQVVCTK